MSEILVIDDDLTYLEHLRDHLKTIGHNVVGLNESAMALSIAEAYNPDLVILGILTCRHGRLILRQLKQSYPQLPVIIYSTYANYRYDPDFKIAEAFVIKVSGIKNLIDKMLSILSPIFLLRNAKPQHDLPKKVANLISTRRFQFREGG